MSNQTKRKYFSLRSGEIYEAEASYEAVLDLFQVPLKNDPKSGCKACRGRLSVGYKEDQRRHVVCPSCAKKAIDSELQAKRLKLDEINKKSSV